MGAFTYITMRYYHGGILNRKSRKPLYEGGEITHIFDVDIDKMSYLELTNDIKELGYTTSCTFYVRPPRSDFLLDIQNDEDIFELSQSFKDGDIVEVYVCHMVDELGGPIGLLEYTPTNEESFGAFNKEGDRGDHEGERVGDINENENEFEAATTQPVAATTQPVASQSSPIGDPKAVAPTQASTTTTATVEPETGTPTQPTFNPTVESVVEDDFSVLDSDQSTENSSDSDHEDLFNEGDVEYESDVHEENINLRAERRSYQRRKRTERAPKDPEEVPVAEVGPDVGFDETEPVDKNLKGKIVGDEHVYCSSDAYSVETDSDNETMRDSRRIIFDKTAEKVMWQLGMVFESVNDFRDAVTKYSLQKGVQLEKFTNNPKKVRVRCRKGCPWLLYASLNRGTNNFVIKTYNPRHRCVKTTRNYMCNAKFLYKHYKDRISEQPNNRIFKFQQLIRNELGIHVGKTTARRARQRILQELMGDHLKEFGRIFYYRDELLRTNPGSTCVVKVDDSEGNGKLVFQSFYICFDACRKAFLGGCRKCIGLDGCFLKGVTKGQLLVVVAKDANNQMLPIAWSVVEYENKNTWAWFLKLLIKDLGLGDGRDYTLISDMQKECFWLIYCFYYCF